MTAKAAPKQNRKDQELAILHQVAQHISSNLELNDLLSHIVEMVINVTGADSCFIYLYDGQNDRLSLKAANAGSGILSARSR